MNSSSRNVDREISELPEGLLEMIKHVTGQLTLAPGKANASSQRGNDTRSMSQSRGTRSSPSSFGEPKAVIPKPQRRLEYRLDPRLMPPFPKKRRIDLVGNVVSTDTELSECDILDSSHLSSQQILTSNNIRALIKALAPYCVKWKQIGLSLGFTFNELEIIQRKPLLLNDAPSSWLTDMLNQWLQWTPETEHGQYATVESLKKALVSHDVGLGAVAEQLREMLKGICMYFTLDAKSLWLYTDCDT